MKIGDGGLTDAERTPCRTMCQRTLILLPRDTMLIGIWFDTSHRHTPIRKHRPNVKQAQAFELGLPHQPTWRETRDNLQVGTNYLQSVPVFRQNNSSSNNSWEQQSAGD